MTFRYSDMINEQSRPSVHSPKLRGLAKQTKPSPWEAWVWPISAPPSAGPFRRLGGRTENIADSHWCRSRNAPHRPVDSVIYAKAINSVYCNNNCCFIACFVAARKKVGKLSRKNVSRCIIILSSRRFDQWWPPPLNSRNTQWKWASLTIINSVTRKARTSIIIARLFSQLKQKSALFSVLNHSLSFSFVRLLAPCQVPKRDRCSSGWVVVAACCVVRLHQLYILRPLSKSERLPGE